MAISKDFLERFLPKPALSGDEDLADKLLFGECLFSCFGGANFRIFITLSTILVPINPGLTLSLALACNRLIAGMGTELPLLCISPLGGRPLDGEHDCRLTLPFATGSIDEERALGTPGLPLVAEVGLSDSDVLKFGGASREKPGISEGFHGLGFTVGELARGGAGFFIAVVEGLATEEEDGDRTGGADIFVAVDNVIGLRVGVAALDVGFDPGLGCLVGVEDLTVDLESGVEDLGVTVGLVDDSVPREVGVADLEGLDEVAVDDVVLEAVFNAGLLDEVKVDLDALNVDRPVGVEGLEPPEEEGLLTPVLEVFNPGKEDACLDVKLLLAVGSVQLDALSGFQTDSSLFSATPSPTKEKGECRVVLEA
nr:ATP binding protein [Ipomoea batatas]